MVMMAKCFRQSFISGFDASMAEAVSTKSTATRPCVPRHCVTRVNCRNDLGHDNGTMNIIIIKRSANTISLNAIVDFRLRRRRH